MVNQLNCLKAGGLVLGIVGTLVALINVFYAIAIYENFSLVEHNFIMNAVIGDAPEHIIRLTYVINAIFDLVAAALLIAGILMKKKYLLLPWIISSLLEIIITTIELSHHLIPAIVLVAIFSAIIYVWYCIVTLYKEMKAEEDANTGVQMAYVDETTNQRNQLPPYSVLTIDKWICE